MNKITTAVIGVGYLGKFHAEKYACLNNSQLVAVVDSDTEKCRHVASRYHCQALNNYKDLLGQVQAVSIVVPTPLHFSIAKDFLQHNAHVLVEKPITTNVAEATELVSLAQANNLKLQVGHLERFNSAIIKLAEILDTPKFIESHRLAPFSVRGTDVNVVLDLMIHDIDIILNIVGANVKKMHASGAPILTDDIDIANVRIEFENDCVANVTASRVSDKIDRKMRIFQNDAYVSVDFQHHQLAVYRKTNEKIQNELPKICKEVYEFTDQDALKLEVESFLNAIQMDTQPLVNGLDGIRALQTAIAISNLLKHPTRSS